ncbi:MAG: hypothetical protein WDZ35_03500 [Crocinitomicaceae bacterium]
MVKGIKIALLVLLFSPTSFGQSERNWKLNAALSFAPGFLTEKTQTIQLHGYLGFLKNKIHLRGDGFYFLNSFGERPRFDMNHQLFSGAFYHFTEKKLQPYIGFQPGIAISRSSEYYTLNEENNELEREIAVSPLGSAVGGLHYYGEKLFFLFVEGRYIFGKHKSNSYPVYLDEFRISFGLGFTF